MGWVVRRVGAAGTSFDRVLTACTTACGITTSPGPLSVVAAAAKREADAARASIRSCSSARRSSVAASSALTSVTFAAPANVTRGCCEPPRPPRPPRPPGCCDVRASLAGAGGSAGRAAGAAAALGASSSGLGAGQYCAKCPASPQRRHMIARGAAGRMLLLGVPSRRGGA